MKLNRMLLLSAVVLGLAACTTGQNADEAQQADPKENTNEVQESKSDSSEEEDEAKKEEVEKEEAAKQEAAKKEAEEKTE